MTSTNMYQGLGNAKPSSRVLRPPGGGSSNLFGGYEEDAAPSRRPNKMASTIFAPPDEPQGGPNKRSNPPGGKSSGIFGSSEAPAQQRPQPPAGSCNFFGAAETSAPVQISTRGHPPKDNLSVHGSEPEPPAPAPAPANVSPPEVKEEPAPPAVSPTKEEPVAVIAVAASPEPQPSPSPPPPPSSSPQLGSEKNHEPHLGPIPRAHNRVINPPGGKSSVVFY